MTRLLAILTVFLAAFGLSSCAKTYVYRQKVTVEVDTPDGVKSGFAVQEVTWGVSTTGITAMGDTASYSVKGEAVAVDLGKGRYLFMLLTRPDELARYAFDDTKESTGTIIVQDHIASLKPGTSAILKREYYPPLVTFGDLNDPKTVQEVDPDNLAAAFGPGYALKNIEIEMTDEKVTSNLEKVLGWVRTLRGSIGKDMHLPYSDLLNKLNDGSFIQGEKR